MVESKKDEDLDYEKLMSILEDTRLILEDSNQNLKDCNRNLKKVIKKVTKKDRWWNRLFHK